MFAASKTASLSGYQIQRSLRFNSADSAYLSRTFGTPTANLTWTLSLWVKLTALSTYRTILSAGTTEIGFSNGNAIWLVAGATTNTSTAIYRDPSAWGHLVISSNGTTMNAYWNNSNVLSAAMTMPQINSAAAHTIGKYAPISADLFDGYMTEVNFIDGQALTPSSFGQTNANTGVWEPKPYAGTYGTNGFYLNFSDNSNTTATTLGKDYSGNGNNWTPNNFSVSAGAGNDSLVDVPTPWGTDTGVGGTVRGNYCTLNPLSTGTNCSPTPMVLTDGNLNFSYNRVTSGGTWAIGTISIPSTGKWYFEFTTQSGTNGLPIYGIASSQQNRANAAVQNLRSYNINNGNKYTTDSSGSVVVNTSYGAVATFGDVIGVAVDCDAGTLAFYKNGVSQGTAFTDVTSSGVEFSPCIYGGAADAAAGAVNFGQRPFAFAAPSGFKALCTQNLPTPTVGATASTQAGKYFNPVLYTGNSAARSITGVGFQPDFTWIKERSSTSGNTVTDVVRGTSKNLVTEITAAEGTSTNVITSFDADGFSLGTDNSINENNQTYVAWNWKANGAGVTNTAGSITSTVSANTTSGFSVVKWNGSGNATIGHGLGVAPSMYIVKLLDNTSQWYVYFRTLGAGKYLQLNLTAGEISDTAIWQNTAPTSTVFSIGSGINANNMVAYCFAEVQGFSKFGSYTGNGSTDGPFVYCGFRPAYVMIKSTVTIGDNSTCHWVIKDKLRAAQYNPQDGNLYSDLSAAEDTTSTVYIDFLSNGFKIRGNYAGINNNGSTYIFAAFAEAPQKFALAR